MKINHAPGDLLQGYGTLRGTVPGPTLGYHDPVYDEEGGQGTAIQTMTGDAQQNPGALLLIVGIIAFLLLMGEADG